jgi:hypothetical protein
MPLVGAFGGLLVSLYLLASCSLCPDYSFCAYSQNPIHGTGLLKNESQVESGKCPVAQGETGVCSDLSSLGNCYDSSYFCKIDSTGLCHCEST